MAKEENIDWPSAIAPILLGVGGLLTAWLFSNNNSNNNSTLPPPPTNQKPSGCGCNHK